MSLASCLDIARGTFVSITGGTFQMGSSLHPLGEELPIRDVTVSSFEMQETPVTFRQWYAYLESGQGPRYGVILFGSDGQVKRVIGGQSEDEVSSAIDLLTIGVGEYFSCCEYLAASSRAEFLEFNEWMLTEEGMQRFLQEDHPAVWLTWLQARFFADWIGGRLPTEAEWEYAARAGRKGDYVYGTASGTWETLREEANLGNQSVPVRQFEANPFGLHGMTGNILEWCEDWWQENYNGLPRQDPRGPVTGEYKSIRGHTIIGGPIPRDYMRVGRRYYFDPEEDDSSLGFRVVRPLSS